MAIFLFLIVRISHCVDTYRIDINHFCYVLQYFGKRHVRMQRSKSNDIKSIKFILKIKYEHNIQNNIMHW